MKIVLISVLLWYYAMDWAYPCSLKLKINAKNKLELTFTQLSTQELCQLLAHNVETITWPIKNTIGNHIVQWHPVWCCSLYCVAYCIYSIAICHWCYFIPMFVTLKYIICFSWKSYFLNRLYNYVQLYRVQRQLNTTHFL